MYTSASAIGSTSSASTAPTLESLTEACDTAAPVSTFWLAAPLNTDEAPRLAAGGAPMTLSWNRDCWAFLRLQAHQPYPTRSRTTTAKPPSAMGLSRNSSTRLGGGGGGGGAALAFAGAGGF